MDAAIALSLYLEACEIRRERHPAPEAPSSEAGDGESRRERFERTSAEVQAISRRVEELRADATSAPTTREDRRRFERELHGRASREATRAEFATAPPEDYFMRLPSLFAEHFVRALAATYRAIRDMGKLRLSSDAALQVIAADLDTALPGLKFIRDSIEHGEERVRLRQHKSKISPASVEIPGFIRNDSPAAKIVAPSGVMTNDTFHITAEDGTMPNIDVSAATIETVVGLVQRALDTLPWGDSRGRRRYQPNVVSKRTE
jgi:hypothetical protein